MFEVEQIEDWKGQDVVDPEGEKIGTLEDVYFEISSGEAALGAVKTGFLGRKTYLVPLEGATLTRDQVQVSHSKDKVTDGPEASEESRLGSEDDQRLAGHYDGYQSSSSEGDGARYESAEGQRQRREQAAAKEEKAGELQDEASEHDEAAEKLRAEAEERRKKAEKHESKASEVRQEADQLEGQAESKRRP